MNSKLKPKIRFKGFTDDWEQRKLDDFIFDLKSGLSRMLSDSDIGLPVVRANNISDCKLDLNHDIKYWYVIDPQGADTSNYFIEKNDILINFINSESKMGTAAIVENKPKRSTIYTTNILRMRLNDHGDSNFYLAQTLTKKYKDYIKGISKIAVNQASFTTVDFRNYQLNAPDIMEQNKIGKLFKNIDNLITLHQRKCDKLVELKKSLLEKIFPQNNSVIPEIRFKGFTDDWEQRKLGEVIISIPLKDKTVFPYSFGKVEVIQQGQVPIAGYSDIPGFENYKDVVLFGDHTLSLYKPVRPFLVASDGVKAFRCDYMNGDYLYRIFEKNLPNNEGYKRYSSILKEQKIKCTINKNEQTKIGNLFRNIDNLITLHQRKHDKLNKIKQSLLNDMFV